MSDEKKPQTLTEEQRAEIRRRWSGVSLGDWNHGFDLSLRCDGQYLFLVVHPDLFKNESALEFLAHARQDMRALLQEVERLRAENKRLEKAANWLANMLASYEGCPHETWLEAFNRDAIPRIHRCKEWEAEDEILECSGDGRLCWVEAAVKVTSEDGNHE